MSQIWQLYSIYTHFLLCLFSLAPSSRACHFRFHLASNMLRWHVGSERCICFSVFFVRRNRRKINQCSHISSKFYLSRNRFKRPLKTKRVSGVRMRVNISQLRSLLLRSCANIKARTHVSLIGRTSLRVNQAMSRVFIYERRGSPVCPTHFIVGECESYM